MKEKLVGKEDLEHMSSLFRGKLGYMLQRITAKVIGLNLANRIYDQSKHLTGVDFCEDMLNKMGVIRDIENEEHINQFIGKPFITVSNHVYGHIDGISLIEKIASKDRSYKLMVNYILGLIDTMSDNFISVDPFATGSRQTTLHGIRDSIKHLSEGHPMGFFPAGAISTLKFKNRKLVIEDRDWQSSIVKLIQKANVPVIPIYLTGRNSMFYYLLRIFGAPIRTMRLCHEMGNKNGKKIRMIIGHPIMPEEIAEFKDVKDLALFLKAKTYALAK